MIKKTIFTSVILFSVWSIVLFAFPNLSVSQHQWQDNYIIAEKYLYINDEIDNVIIGSSLSSRIIKDSLPGFYNLSFAGQSTFDGLQIIQKKTHTPKNVFIEINVLDRGENKTFTKSLTSPINYITKERLIAFRSDKQPLAIFGNYVLQPFAEWVHSLLRRAHNKMAKKSFLINKPSSSSLFVQMKALQIERHSHSLTNNKTIALLENLKSAVQELELKNINVTFFEMPINIEIHSLSKPNQIRLLIQKNFPNNAFISAPQNLEMYKTSDGVHLLRNEAALYTHYLKSEIETVAKKQ